MAIADRCVEVGSRKWHPEVQSIGVDFFDSPYCVRSFEWLCSISHARRAARRWPASLSKRMMVSLREIFFRVLFCLFVAHTRVKSIDRSILKCARRCVLPEMQRCATPRNCAARWHVRHVQTSTHRTRSDFTGRRFVCSRVLRTIADCRRIRHIARPASPSKVGFSPTLFSIRTCVRFCLTLIAQAFSMRGMRLCVCRRQLVNRSRFGVLLCF
jgi:hypothetical protein